MLHRNDGRIRTGRLSREGLGLGLGPRGAIPREAHASFAASPERLSTTGYGHSPRHLGAPLA